MKLHEEVEVAQAAQILVDVCHGASARAGWWKDKDGFDLKAVINNPVGTLEKSFSGALVAQKLCLVHSEISEAMEGHRKGLMDDKLPTRPMIEVELADALIRICDLAGALRLDLSGAIADKLAFNATREDHKPENRQKAGGKAY
jgi:NTP pyrophosphatase (non-canonical NTP hydrolase)